ncbi:MAG: glycosyl transferase family 36 [Ignavibacteria bacterium]|jgi:cellobiose phosphorylase|nr:glycosyl transferase family 36 [Ignavibacteria bacterium]MCU7504565.1 glycosyl transferase family 36 [Ignavibacteria bacterium]MCU7516597.1 glycosyl transferase family 36 [Ignavibacteria bacterium]
MKNTYSNSLFETKYGSFSSEGNEYIIKTPRTPKPWVNVISNGEYGMVISQAGGGFSFQSHSEFNRLTRWHQDLIKDDWGKYIYVKNDLTGEVWSPTWMPVKSELDFFECRHGLGYSVFTSEYKGISIILTIFVPFGGSLEIWDLKIQNNSGKKAELSFYNYFEWCLGSSGDFHREFHRTFIETRFDKKLNAVVAGKRLWEIPLGDRGHWNTEYAYKGFFSCSRTAESFECDKEMFLGQYGSLERPKEVETGTLSETSGNWYDPIACLKVRLSLEAGQLYRFHYCLGLSKEVNEIGKVLSRYRTDKKVDEALSQVAKTWESLLSPLEIDTPDEAMNLMVNRWLPYQAISGRLWARTAYYQQSGAFGFRDQLQDSLVYLPLNPDLTQKQILYHARHQKKDGTVLHWWHPITETGLETIMTDDLLWLPFLVLQYINETGEDSILKVKEPFYDDEKISSSLLEHSIRAIDRVLERMSKRGLPFIGAGDWNDGLSAVGLDWKGESIWLAEFLYYVVTGFSGLLESHSKKKKSEEYNVAAQRLKKAFEKHAWDGEWFFRATKDSGEKIGSRENSEGKIYLNAQSWAVISGITSDERKNRAMDAVEKYLLKDFGPLLLSPAYSKPDKYIGYLSRYAAGKRENGGVYMHAAAWSIWAFSLLGREKAAYEVFRRICPVYNGMEPDKYAAEPYVNPGNIDGPESAFYGRGGWTWYTGSAAWLQKVIVERILGLRVQNGGLVIAPCIPSDWESYSVKRKFRGTVYNIRVLNPDHVSCGIKSILLDGSPYAEGTILPQKKKEVSVEVMLGQREF